MQIDDPNTRPSQDATLYQEFVDEEWDLSSTDEEDGRGSPTPMARRSAPASFARPNGMATAMSPRTDCSPRRRRTESAVVSLNGSRVLSPNPGAAARRAAFMALQTMSRGPETPSKAMGRITLRDTPLTSPVEDTAVPDVLRTPSMGPLRTAESPSRRYDPTNRTPVQTMRHHWVQKGIDSRGGGGVGGMSPPPAPDLGARRNLMPELEALQTSAAQPKGVTGQWDPAQPLRARSDSELYVQLIAPCLFFPELHYGVQWELARLMGSRTDLTWDDLRPEDIGSLYGDALSAMPKVSEVLNGALARVFGEGAVVPIRSLTPTAAWAEMDREERAIGENGMAGVFNDADDRAKWPYGGRLVYAVSVHSGARKGTPASSGFTFKLLPIDAPTKSTRIARRLGSRRVLTLRFKDVPRRKRAALFEFLCGRRLVLFGRVFRVLWIPPDSDHAIAVQTLEVDGGPVLVEPVFSFRDLVEGYNSMGAKPRQAMAKWAARTQLLQSDSVPACRVPLAAVAEIDDVVCGTAGKRPASAQILTDGCGLMSAALARRIMLHPNFGHLTTRPCAVQMRYGGSKGLLVLMSDQQHVEYAGKDIVLRDSMIKSLPSSTFANDPSLTTLDVLKTGSLKFGVNISSEPIIVMWHNGVPEQVIVDKVQEGINAIGRELDPAPSAGERGDAALRRVMNAAYRLGGVAAKQRKREAASKGQSLKVAGLVWHDKDTPCEDKDEITSTGERLYRLLRAGFNPVPGREGCSFAATQLRNFVEMLTNRAVKEYKISVEQSLTGFIVPDPLGLLKPNEIFVAPSTEQPIDPETMQSMPYLTGDCLVYRSPCKLPTDVRKVTAVYHPELSYLRDCIVFSANAELCTVSPASMLGGGDYDGDTATVIWDRALVEPFVNAPDHFASPPTDFESTNFVKDVVRVDQFMAALDGASDEAWVRNMQHFLLANVLDEQLTGIYSGLHDVSVYTRGLAHPETMRLAHMFCNVLDARKSGLCVRGAVRKRDMQANSTVVAWRETKRDKGERQDNVTVAVRPAHMPRFIMDVLGHAARAAQISVLEKFSDPKASPSCQELVPLAAAYRAALEEASTHAHDAARAARLRVQLDTLLRHVEAVAHAYAHVYRRDADMVALYEAHMHPATAPPRTLSRASSRATTASDTSTPSNGTNGAGRPSTAAIRARLRDLASIWHTSLTPGAVPDLAPFGFARVLAQLKVSCAVHIAAARHVPVKLPFDVDFETTCSMMAEVASGGATTTMPCTTAACHRPIYL